MISFRKAGGECDRRLRGGELDVAAGERVFLAVDQNHDVGTFREICRVVGFQDGGEARAVEADLEAARGIKHRADLFDLVVAGAADPLDIAEIVHGIFLQKVRGVGVDEFGDDGVAVGGFGVSGGRRTADPKRVGPVIEDQGEVESGGHVILPGRSFGVLDRELIAVGVFDTIEGDDVVGDRQAGRRRIRRMGDGTRHGRLGGHRKSRRRFCRRRRGGGRCTAGGD